VTDGRQSSADDSPEITEVRRLLADSRVTEPMPDDVAARMDRVLADLSGAPPAVPREPVAAGHPEVVPIAAHRRRRAAGLLVAAAAIVVGGFAVAQSLPSPDSSGAATTSAAEEHTGALDDGVTSKSPPSSPTHANRNMVLRHGRVIVRPQHFTEDALQGRRLLGREFAGSPVIGEPCTQLAGSARAVPAEYRHAPAVLVFRRPEGASQVVDLYVCGNPRAVRSSTLPAP